MFVPSIDLADASQASLYASLSLFGSVILKNDQVGQINSLISQTGSTLYWAYADSVDKAIQLWDAGILKVIFPLDLYLESKDELADIAQDRIAIVTTVTQREQLEALSNSVSTFIIKAVDDKAFDNEVLSSLSTFAAGAKKCLLGHGGQRTTVVEVSQVSIELISKLNALNLDVVVPADRLTANIGEDDSKLNIAEAFLATSKTDRPDGLYTTMIVDEFNKALGLVYSSKQSVAESVRLGQGVYQSRNRGLWHKGLTSGATQTLKHIDYDCDGDTLRFVVEQHGQGFCHLNTRTCFGHDSGITALEKTLKERKSNAPVGSYTARLFSDSNLLRAKIMEEAEELCDATEKEEVAWEAADLIYFALTKCVSAGVSLADIENNLNKKARKVTRRPGNAKPKWEAKQQAEKEEEDIVPTAPIAPAVAEQARIEMMKFSLNSIDEKKRSELLLRPIIDSTEIINRVTPIMKKVREGGDEAIKEFTRQFDRVELENHTIKAPFDPKIMEVDDLTKKAIDQAYANIHKFHEAQLDKETLVVETMPGIVCSRFSRPIERVGLYVPGGTAVLPSTTLMLGIPAKVAGCKEIVIATPPRSNGTVAPEVAYVAHKVGASHILMAGGAQAVAGMAYGTETVPKVDKIFGPGNQYVTAAKMVAQNDTSCLVSIDMPAGPSEVLVIADKTSNPAYVAADLLSQAEHGADSQVVLLAVDLTEEHLKQIEDEVNAQASVLPRVDIIRKSIPHSFSLSVKTLEEAMQFSNDYAPEHLILHLKDAANVLPLVDNAGSVFVGEYSPESFGDYASGTNHTLPTYGYSRMYSGVNTNGFVKHITSQEITAEGLDGLADTVMRLAEIEGLDAHRNAVAVRIADLRK